MRKVYTSIDLGSESIKIVTMELIYKKWHVLASSSTLSKGIKKGIITNEEETTESLKNAIKEHERILGIKIDKAIILVPSNCKDITISEGTIEKEEENTTTYSDITKCLQDSLIGKVIEKNELVTIMPIIFKINDEESVKFPIGMLSKKLYVKVVITSVPKDILKRYYKVMNNVEIEIVDICFSEVGDYYEIKDKQKDQEVGAIVNIGYDILKITIFNKGIMVKSEIVEIGSKYIDKDIKYVYHLDKDGAIYLKERFSISNKRYADSNDIMEIVDIDNNKISIKQTEISEVVESRLIEILKLAQEKINILTKKEISYIIITGGISELAGFQYVIDNTFGKIANVLNINTIGVRNNRYSSAIGVIKYFYEKLSMRGKNYTMFNDYKTEELKFKKKGILNENLIEKMFGYFSGNNN